MVSLHIENSGDLLALEVQLIKELPKRYNQEILDIYDDPFELIINELTARKIIDYWDINLPKVMFSCPDKVYGYEVSIFNPTIKESASLYNWLKRKFNLPF